MYIANIADTVTHTNNNIFIIIFLFFKISCNIKKNTNKYDNNIIIEKIPIMLNTISGINSIISSGRTYGHIKNTHITPDNK